MLVTSQNRLVTACRGAACVVIPHPANAYRPYVFRHPVLGFLNALILCATLGASLLISLTPDVARLSTITASTLVKLTNTERQKAGLPSLSENSALVRSAQLKGEHMLRHDYFDHTSPDGISPWAWFDRAKYPYLYAGENLAIDFSDAEGVVAAWLQSPGHRRNLLSDRYSEIGMAVVTGEFEGRTATIVVQHFGKRLLSSEISAQLPASSLPVVASESRTRETPVPRTIRADATGLDMTLRRAVLLPDPQQRLGRVLLVVPAGAGVRSLEVLLPNQTAIPFERTGDVLSARLETPPLGPLDLRATDTHGNTQTIQWQPFLSYMTAEAPTKSARLQFATAVSALRPWLSLTVLIFAALFVMNLLVHLRFRHVLHLDLIAHAFVVVVLGAAVMFFT